MTGNDVTWQKVAGSYISDVISPEITWKWLLKAYKSSFGYFELLQGCNSQEVAVT